MTIFGLASKTSNDSMSYVCFRIQLHLDMHPIFQNAFGDDVQMFQYLCAHVGPLIERKDTNWRPCVTVEERMEVVYLTSSTCTRPR